MKVDITHREARQMALDVICNREHLVDLPFDYKKGLANEIADKLYNAQQVESEPKEEGKGAEERIVGVNYFAEDVINEEIRDIIDCILKFDPDVSAGQKAIYFDTIQRDLKNAIPKK